MHKLILSFLVFVLPFNVFAANPLAPLKTGNPRDTMRSFMEAMNDYKKGLQTGDHKLKARLNDAARCLNLEDVPLLNRSQVGRNAAILLKEVIDRVTVIDYDQIPEKSEDSNQPLVRWTLPETEITISKVEKGDHVGEFLFTPDTVARANEFYDKVEHLPYLKGTTGGAGYHTPWLERNMPSWATKTFWGLIYWQWIEIFLTIVTGVVIGFAVSGIAKLIDRLTHKKESNIRFVEIMSAPTSLLVTTGVWFIALHLFQLEGTALHIMNVCLQILLFAALTWFFYRSVELFSPYLKKIIHRANTKIDDQLFQLLDRALKILVIIIGILLGLQNLGVQVVSLMAGLGIGGLAFALAAKDTLANFFGSLMIMFDRPFQVGHYIIVKGVDGTVEDIGFRSTRLRTPQNTLISIPNSEIAITNVENFSLRHYRRVRTTIGVTYGTLPEKLEAFIEGIKKIILANPHTKKDTDSIQVAFAEFAESSLSILVNFYLSVPDLISEMEEKQNIFLEIMRLAQKLGVSFAFPTQSVHIETMPKEK